LYHTSRAAEFGITEARFTEILEDIAARHWGVAHGLQAGKQVFLQTLRLRDLALARGCADGNPLAWERFVSLYRDKLRAFALSIAHDPSAARELADSLYGDLFRGKFHTYCGRGTLESWLRAVVAREYTDRYRASRNLVSYDAAESAGVQFAAEPEDDSEDHPADHALLERALDTALSMLDAEDRFVLSAHYLDGRTLAAIATALSVHESTISRRLARITRNLRRSTVGELRKLAVDSRRVEEMLRSDVRDLTVDVRRRLVEAP
jgi:RNA polymerase sigma-70 factor (ECF subfamily)